MRPTGKRIAIAVGAVAAVVIAVAGFLLHDDIRWWWRMRGVAQVTLADDAELSYPIEFSRWATVRRASVRTKKFLLALTGMHRANDAILVNAGISVSSSVRFGRNVGKMQFGRQLFDMDFLQTEENEGIVDSEAGNYKCSLEAWKAYFRGIVELGAPELIAIMKDPKRDKDHERKNAAKALVWVVGRGILEQPDMDVLEGIAKDKEEDEDLRRLATAALQKIRGER